MNPTTISGHSEITSEFLLPNSNFSPHSSPLNISGIRQGKKTKPIEPVSKSPPGSSKVQHVPCKFFKNGACTAGKNCVFSHSKEIQPSDTVCKYYAKGNCKFGNKCALQHGNEKKVNNRNNLKPRSQNSHGPERVRQNLEQRSLLDFSEELDFLSRSFSRVNLDQGYTGFGNSPNNLNYYTPQLKTSQLSNIFSSPNQNIFSSSLPSQQNFPGIEETGSPGSTFNSKYTSMNAARFLSKNEFSSPNFSFGFSDEHDLLPSSLDELLTPTELQMRKTKANMLSRPGFMNMSHNPETLGISPAASRFLSNFDNDYFGTSLPSGSSLGITEPANLLNNQNEFFSNPKGLSESLTYDDLLSKAHVKIEEDNDENTLSETSEAKKGDDRASDTQSSDDDVVFRMEGDF